MYVTFQYTQCNSYQSKRFTNLHKMAHNVVKTPEMKWVPSRLSTCHLVLANRRTVLSHMVSGPLLVLYTKPRSTLWNEPATYRNNTSHRWTLHREKSLQFSQLHINLDPQNVQNKLLQLDFRPDNMTTTTNIQLELYWHPVHLKFRVLLQFLLYRSSGIQLQRP